MRASIRCTDTRAVRDAHGGGESFIRGSRRVFGTDQSQLSLLVNVLVDSISFSLCHMIYAICVSSGHANVIRWHVRLSGKRGIMVRWYLGIDGAILDIRGRVGIDVTYAWLTGIVIAATVDITAAGGCF